MTAVFQIEQSSSTPGPGIARQDIVPDVVVNFEATDAGSHSTFEWEVISAARDAVYTSLTSPPGEPHKASCTFTSRGGYLVRLIVDKETSTEDVSVLYVGLPLENSGLPIPALAETNQDTSQPPYSGWFGAYEKVDAFFKWLDANVSGGGSGIFIEDAGTRSTVRVDQLSQAEGEDSFAFGYRAHTLGDHSVAIGPRCITNWACEVAQSPGRVGATYPGQAQASRVLLSGETSNSPSSIELSVRADASAYLEVDSNTAYACSFNIVAKHANKYSSGNLMSVAWKGEFLVVTDLAEDPQVIGININRYAETANGNEADWDIAISVDTVDNKIVFTATADSLSSVYTVRWLGYVDVARLSAYHPSS